MHTFLGIISSLPLFELVFMTSLIALGVATTDGFYYAYNWLELHVRLWLAHHGFPI